MATRQSRTLARFMMAPSVVVLLIWMIVPLALTLWFSFQNYNLLNPITSFAGWSNYTYFLTDPAFTQALVNTLILVVGVLLITVIGGVFIALLLDQPIFGQGIVRILVISPFFIMPPVAALVWKNMLMNPEYGLFADIARAMGQQPVDWFAQLPLLAIIIIVAWQWLPFSTLILLTALQSLSEEQKEAAEMDGASAVNRFFYIILPHIARAITVVILIQTIFLLGDLRRGAGHHQWRPWLQLDQHRLPRLSHRAPELRRRRRLGRRRHRGDHRQHRRHLPDASRGEEPRCVIAAQSILPCPQDGRGGPARLVEGEVEHARPALVAAPSTALGGPPPPLRG